MATVTSHHSTTEDLRFSLENPAIAALYERSQELTDLGSISALLGWDQQTQMAMGSNIVRGPQSATLDLIIHERKTSAVMRHALDEAEAVVTADPGHFTLADHALVRTLRRDVDEAVKIPDDFVRDFALAQASAWEAWISAKKAKNYAIFAPHLGKMIEFSRRKAALLNPDVPPYEALFAEFEPGLTFKECMDALTKVREATVVLLKRIAQAQTISDAALHGDFAPDKEMELSKTMLTVMGYQFENGRIDLAAHPFMTSLGTPYDIRVTTRLDPNRLGRALLPAMHEGGHALYELGVSPALTRTTLAHGTSLGIHESQSRFWENIIGRAEPFWHAHFDKVREIFPEHFAAISVEEFVRALNRVQADLIRVEADELTYNLHIIIRTEMEIAMVEGTATVEELPALWNQKYFDYLGVRPANDAEGILQDVHWSYGNLGYFPTYSLGNMFAAQFATTLYQVFPDLDARLAAGETRFIREWQRENIHQWGRIFDANDLSIRVTGEPLNPDHFITYVTNKFTRLYGLS